MIPIVASASPFHEGERRVQERLGVREAIEPWARQVVRDHLPQEHRDFYGSLPFVVVAARDGAGRPWATLLAGAPGFASSPDPRRLVIDARPVPGDALEGALVEGADLGLLGIELESRRRNRVNGRIGGNGAGPLALEVDQTFGNCPQYIHERAWRRVPVPDPPPAARRGRGLSAAMQARIANADTFFIASGHGRAQHGPVYGMDASHRGGNPGFVSVESDTRLVFPDYAGNDHFNTIGNLVADPRAGLLFVDFEHGSLLQLTGRADIDWDSADLSRFPGARRLVRFELEEAVELEAALPMRWSAPTEFVRTLRLVEKTAESDDVTSFVFEARDGGPLPEFEAGQHLPIQLAMPDRREPVRRTYSLSNAPGEGRYRISVKREGHGLASRFLHDEVSIGVFVDALRPAGEFVLAKSVRPVVLVSAGVGLTPMVSMLHALVRKPLAHPVWFIHGARDGAHHPLAAEVRDLVAGRAHIHAHVAYSRPRGVDVRGIDFDSIGRIDAGLIARLLPDLDSEFYLCGPTAFMASVRQGLTDRGVDPDRIHAETFGPVGCASCG